MRFSALILLFFMFTCHAKKMNVTLVFPDHDGHEFWHIVADVGQSTTKSLNANLEVIYSDNNRFSLQKELIKISQRSNKPDYVIFRPFQGNALDVFSMLEKNDIKFVTLEQAFVDDEAKSLGLPQQYFKNWLGQINYNNKQGGKLLTNTLLKAHQVNSPNKTAYITGISGNFDAVATDRHQSLIDIMPDNNAIKVQQIFSMNWDAKIVLNRFPGIIKRYPDTNIFWCAGDSMALAVISKIQSSPVLRDNNIVIGGFDWLPEALQKINSGELTASVGGHFLMAAQAMVKVYEHHQGLPVQAGKSKLHNYEVIDASNVIAYRKFIENSNWRGLDYTLYSSFHHKNAPELTVNNLIKQYNQKF